MATPTRRRTQPRQRRQDPIGIFRGKPFSTVCFRELGRRGRFGNAIWSIASTVGIAAKHHAEVKFPPWDYADVFQVPDEWFGEIPDDAIDSPLLASPPLHPWAANYLQHLPLWEDAQETVRRALKFTPWALDQLVDYSIETGFAGLKKPVCAVHVRRGDVLRNPPGTINVLPASYYRDAISLAWEAGAASICVITDDPDWCQQLPHDLIVAGKVRPPEWGLYEEVGPVDWHDLALGTLADSWVISNATFGWWMPVLAGVTLDGTPAPMIAPSRWFGPKLGAKHAANKFIADGWRVLEVRDE